MTDRYLTTGQVAELTGVSRGTILRAVRRGDLSAALQLPGGALRFLPSVVETFVRDLNTKSDPHAIGSSTKQEAGSSAQSGSIALQERAGHPLDTSHTDAEMAAICSGILALVADNLHGGATFLARMGSDTWLVDQLEDRMGMGLKVGERAPFAALYSIMLTPESPTSLVCEDVHRDTRFAALADSHPSVGSFICVPLAGADGQVYSALGVVRPFAGPIDGHDIATVRLAGSVILQVAQATSARQRLQAVWDASEDAMVVSDAGGTVLATNPAVRRLVEHGRQALVGQDFSLMFAADERPRLRETYQQLFQQEEPVPAWKTSILGPDGARRVVEASVSFVRYGEYPRAMLSIVRDITARQDTDRSA